MRFGRSPQWTYTPLHGYALLAPYSALRLLKVLVSLSGLLGLILSRLIFSNISVMSAAILFCKFYKDDIEMQKKHETSEIT